MVLLRPFGKVLSYVLQAVILSASISILFSSFSCKKKVDATEIPENFDANFLNVTLDEKFLQIVDQENSYINGAEEMNFKNSEGKYVYMQSSDFKSFKNVKKNFFRLGIVTVFEEDFVTNKMLDSAIKESSFLYGTILGDGSNGAIVEYLDENGELWASYLGSGEQKDKLFYVISYVEKPDGGASRMIRILFRCNLYNAAGDRRTFSNGELKGRIIK